MKKTFLAIAMVIALAFGTMAPAIAQGKSTSGNAANSLGKTTLDTNVSSWEVGSGQFNGEFVTAEVQGIELGLRAQHRFEGLLGVTGTNGNRVGVYEAATGDTGGNNATWNYDFHIDLSGATGNAEGRTLADYRLVLEQDFTAQSLFGTLGSDPVELPLGEEGVDGVCSTGTFDAEFLCQQSWNPGFGNTDFDPNAEGTYNLRLVLTPETFNGPPLAVKIQVDVAHLSTAAVGDALTFITSGGADAEVSFEVFETANGHVGDAVVVKNFSTGSDRSYTGVVECFDKSADGTKAVLAGAADGTHDYFRIVVNSDTNRITVNEGAFAYDCDLNVSSNQAITGGDLTL